MIRSSGSNGDGVDKVWGLVLTMDLWLPAALVTARSKYAQAKNAAKGCEGLG